MLETPEGSAGFVLEAREGGGAKLEGGGTTLEGGGATLEGGGATLVKSAMNAGSSPPEPAGTVPWSDKPDSTDLVRSLRKKTGVSIEAGALVTLGGAESAPKKTAATEMALVGEPSGSRREGSVDSDKVGLAMLSGSGGTNGEGKEALYSNPCRARVLHVQHYIATTAKHNTHVHTHQHTRTHTSTHIHTQHTCTHNTHAHTHTTHMHTQHTCTHNTHAHTTHMHTQHTCKQYTCTHTTHTYTHNTHAHTTHMHTQYTRTHNTHTHIIYILSAKVALNTSLLKAVGTRGGGMFTEVT